MWGRGGGGETGRGEGRRWGRGDGGERCGGVEGRGDRGRGEGGGGGGGGDVGAGGGEDEEAVVPGSPVPLGLWPHHPNPCLHLLLLSPLSVCLGPIPPCTGTPVILDYNPPQ